MDRDKIIILALIVIIAALLVGVVAMMPNTKKQDTKLTFESNATLTEGDSIKIKLTDVNGTAIANQKVNITITDKNNASDYHSVVTDEDGGGKIKLDKEPGEYTVTISYDGNDNYTASNATQNLKIKEKVVKEVTSVSSTSSNDVNYLEGPEVDSHGVTKEEVLRSGYRDVKYDPEGGIYVQYDPNTGTYHD